MKVQCAWCHKVMCEKEPLADTRVTHGICPACLAKVEAEYQRVTGRKLEKEEEE